MAPKKNTSLVAFQCPDKLVTIIDGYSYENMMDRTEFIVAALSKFVEYYENEDVLGLHAESSDIELVSEIESEDEDSLRDRKEDFWGEQES